MIHDGTIRARSLCLLWLVVAPGTVLSWSGRFLGTTRVAIPRATSHDMVQSSSVNVENSVEVQVVGRVSPQVDAIKASKTVEVFSLVGSMREEGIEVTSLCVGEPDYPPPPQVMEAAAQALREGQTRYTAVNGIGPLRTAIARDLAKRKGVTYDPATEIVVSNGAKQSVYQAVVATCGGMTDAAVLVPTPCWPSYPEMVALAGAECVLVDTPEEDGYLLSPESLRATLETNTNSRLLILCNPGNPTGGVYSGARLEALAEVLRDYPEVTVLADEIYERLVYAPASDTAATPMEHVSFASLEGMRDRTITVNGFSKAYAMTGFRLGYVAAPVDLARACSKIQSQLTSCAGSVSQAAAVAALTEVPESWMEDRVGEMADKRDYVLGRLAQMPGVRLSKPPEGAFYVLPDLSEVLLGAGGGKKNDGNLGEGDGHGDGPDDAAFCVDLLRQQKLALVPGSSFHAPGTVRISYAASHEELRDAMDKLEEHLRSLVLSS